MAIEICPHCQDFTEQTPIKGFEERRKIPYWVKSTTKIYLCHICQQTIEHESIHILESAEYAYSALSEGTPLRQLAG